MRLALATLITLLAASAGAPRTVSGQTPHPRTLSGWYDDYANEDGMYNEGDPYGAWQDGWDQAQDPFQVSSDWLLNPRPPVRISPGHPGKPRQGSTSTLPARK